MAVRRAAHVAAQRRGRGPWRRAVVCRAAAPSEEPPAAFQLAYEMVRGPLAEWSDTAGGRHTHPYTGVLLHGVLGSRRNLITFARRLAEAHPAWQFLVVDLRCHGASARHIPPNSNTVRHAADDVLRLLRELALYPHALIGHSFGGKVTAALCGPSPSALALTLSRPYSHPTHPPPCQVAMGMVHAFGDRLPRPVQARCARRVPTPSP